MSARALLNRLPIDPYNRGDRRHGRQRRHRSPLLLAWARLSPEAAPAARTVLRRHLVVLASTFVLFPALGLSAKALAPGLLTPPLWTGVILLLRLAFHRPIVDRLHLDRPRQRGGRDLRRHGVQPPGDGADAVAGRAAARRAGRIFGAWRRRHRPSASRPLRRRPARPAVGRRVGAAPQDAARPGRSRIDPAGRLRRVQRGRDARDLASAQPRRPRERKSGSRRRGSDRASSQTSYSRTHTRSSRLASRGWEPGFGTRAKGEQRRPLTPRQNCAGRG